MTVKDFKTYDEQIDLLASRGISLSTSDQRGRAKKILQHEGYYNLINGYKKMFLVPPSEDARQDYVETYKTGTTIDEIHALYLFDQKLREAIFPFVLKIETNIKSLIAYYFPKEHGYANYLVYTNFDTTKKDAAKNITTLISNLHQQLSSRYSDPSIRHYLSVYGYVPLWVLNNILTLGTISKFYSLMLQPERQAIANIFGLSDSNMESFIYYITSIRNFCAHGNRLFCFRSKHPLADTDIHKELNIPKNKNNEYAYGKRDLFAVFIILKTLLPRNDFSRLIKKIERAVQTLQTRISVISINDVYREMGFPEDWKSKLLSPRHVIIPDVAAEIATTIRQNDLYISTTMNRMEIHSYKDGL